MSANLNPSGIMPTSDSPVIDFKGDKKYLKISLKNLKAQNENNNKNIFFLFA